AHAGRGGRRAGDHRIRRGGGGGRGGPRLRPRAQHPRRLRAPLDRLSHPHRRVVVTPTDVLVVSGEPLWPSVHGGRIRTARIAEALARHLTVRVAAPVEGEGPDGVRVDPLPEPPIVRRWRLTVGASPALGRFLLGPDRVRAVAGLVARHRPGTVLF